MILVLIAHVQKSHINAYGVVSSRRRVLNVHLYLYLRPLVIGAYQKKNKPIFLFLNQTICCGYSKEPFQ